ncbi:MAG: trigger factor [Chitinophagaceae bacterium]
MPTITRNNVAPLTDKITVQLTKEDYYPNFEKALKTYSKQVKMQGFRPGQVPLGLIKKMYGASIFSDEILKTVEKEINGYLTQENPEIFAQPLPTDENFAAMRGLDMNEPKELNFSFEIGLKPAFSIADLSKSNIKRHKVDVTDAMIDEEVARLQTRMGNMSEPESVTSDKNVLNVTFTELDADGNEVEGGVTKDNSLLVSYFSEAVRPQLMGLNKDNSLTIKLSEAFEAKELDFILNDLGLSAADSDKSFKLTVTKVSLVEDRELNEEFFNQVYVGKALGTETEFRQAIKEDIEAYYFNQDRGQVDDQIYHYLLDNTQIDLPEDFLKRWQKQAEKEPKTEEDIEKGWPSFKNSLKWTLISDTIIKEAKIDVDPEEIRMFAKHQMMGYMGGQGNPEDMPWLDTYIDKMTKDQKFVENTYNQIATDKLFAMAETMVQYKDELMSVDEFTKQQEHHKEHHHH